MNSTPSSSVTLATLLSEKQIIPNMVAVDRWQAIEEIVQFLIQGGFLQAHNKEDILAALAQREETMSTGIGFGVAIPHAASDSVHNIIVAFARSKEGIEFESLDEKPVHFIVLFLVPNNQFQTHLKTLSAIAKFLNDRVTREELMTAQDAMSIMKIFANKQS
ncbi:MAG: PTS sugar transporter subunit IIA [Chthoniobacterales bacterium]